MQATAPVAASHELKEAVLRVYDTIDAAYTQFPKDHFYSEFAMKENHVYDGQRLFLGGPDGEEFLLDRPDPSKGDLGVRTVEVMAHDNIERMFLLGNTGTSVTLINPEAADEITSLFFGWPVIPQILEKSVEEIDEGIAETDRTVRPFHSTRHAEALGSLISQGRPLDHRHLRSV